MDKKFEKLFNKYFSLDNFDGDEELMENFKELFLSMMNVSESKIEDVKDIDMFNIGEDMKNIMKGNEEFKTLNGEQTQTIINKFNMKIKSIETNREPNMQISMIKVSEEWTTENSNYIIQQSYYLNLNSFNERKYDVKLLTIDELIEANLFNSKEHEPFMAELLDVDKEIFYNKLIDISLEYENYEDAAFYRDLIDSK